MSLGKYVKTKSVKRDGKFVPQSTEVIEAKTEKSHWDGWKSFDENVSGKPVKVRYSRDYTGNKVMDSYETISPNSKEKISYKRLV